MPFSIDRQQSLGELVARWPFAAGVLERHHLDFCCNGKTKLEAACAAAGISLEQLGKELETAAPFSSNRSNPPAADWNTAPLPALIAHIISTYHQRLRAWLPELDKLAFKINAVHGQRHPELLDIRQELDRLSTELHSHMDKEEYILFPYIEQLASLLPGQAGHHTPPFGSVRHPISVMLREHAQAGESLDTLRRMTAGFSLPADACASWQAYYARLRELESDLHTHIHLENNILFPRAEALETSLN